MFSMVGQADDLIQEKLKLVTDIFGFDTGKTVSNHQQTNNFCQPHTVASAALDIKAFTEDDIDQIIEHLSVHKRAVIVNKAIPAAVDGFWAEVSTGLYLEIYVPFFDDHMAISGFVYLGKSSCLSENDLNSISFWNEVAQLIHLIEIKLRSYKLQENLFDTVLLLCEVVNAKQPFLISNLNTVYMWAHKIAVYLNLSQIDIQKLQFATLMHDLGKIYIVDSILNKKGKMSAEEYGIMKTIVPHSYEIASKLNMIYAIDDVPLIILNYQERIDGRGYPNGVKGNDIPLLSKILHMAKAMSAMLSNTLYRKAMPIDAIIKEIRANAGSQFDSAIAEAAISLLINKREKIGDYFSDIGNYTTLSITLVDGCILNIWGHIRKAQEYFLFRPMEIQEGFEHNQIKSAFLYLNHDDYILEFKAEIDSASQHEIKITKLISLNEEKSFSINWSIEGCIITHTHTVFDINIIVVGGDYLDFYIPTEKLTEPITSGVVQVNLSEEHVSYLTGVIIFQQQIRDKVYYKFEYSSLPDSERKQVFSSIFRKQIEMKRLIHSV